LSSGSSGAPRFCSSRLPRRCLYFRRWWWWRRQGRDHHRDQLHDVRCGTARGGRPADAGATYAIQTAATVKGFKLTAKNYDDAVNGVHDPQKGAQNFTDMVTTRRSSALSVRSKLDVARPRYGRQQGETRMISPSNTNECLTQDFSYCDPKPAALP